MPASIFGMLSAPPRAFRRRLPAYPRDRAPEGAC
ncbi:hypothetical protein SFR_3066 [Streptomyces sp. FR-008]|nr:hypothetical protein SFR_3066 [Streptomyces sp. FR-008]